MALEDFEKSLAEEKSFREHKSSRHHDHHHRKQHHRKHRHSEDDRDHHRHKRRRNSHDGAKSSRRRREDDQSRISDSENMPAVERVDISKEGAKRDAWMEQPSGLDIDFTQRGVKQQKDDYSKSTKKDFELKIHENELNRHHLQNMADGQSVPEDVLHEPAQHDVTYLFGDSGSSWRMTKLKAVYRNAEQQRIPVEEAALNHYGELRSFDDAREEREELERRDMYGEGYVGKEKPSGDLFAERKIESGVRRSQGSPDPNRRDSRIAEAQSSDQPAPQTSVIVDQSTLNRLKAKMLKAKLKGPQEAAAAEEEYNRAVASMAKQSQSGDIILSAMDSRMVASGQRHEVRQIDSRRGRERGLVEDNEDMTIEDMVREERRNRGQAGGDGRRFAERIAKDGKFDNDLEYLDENAAKLAKRVQKSDINLRNMAISEFQKLNKVLDNCPLCHHEDTDKPPLAPIISLGTRVYLTIPTEPEIIEGGACIIPIQHRDNLLYCDDDEWEEIRNFMKSLTRMYHDQGRDVIFYENAAAPHRKRHAGMEVVPLPYTLGDTAPAFFKEAILSADEEWTQHKKLIDTQAMAKNRFGKGAFRRSLAKEMPYFHVWFTLDGGLGHVVEDENRWPKGDLFAREIIGGMLDIGPDVIKRQGRWRSGTDPRADGFKRRWRKFDWTRVLHDE